MEIKQFIWNVVDSNSWLVVKKNHGLLIDVIENEELFKAVKRLESLTVILTHSHFDHIVGLNKIRNIRPDCKVIATKLCSEHIGNKYRNMSSSATAFMSFYRPNEAPIQIDPIECEPAEEVFEDYSEFEWYGNTIRLFAVYGHTNDGLIVEINDEYLFSGDTLLNIPTVTRFPSGNRGLFFAKDIPLLQGLKALTIFPGHGQIRTKNSMLNKYT